MGSWQDGHASRARRSTWTARSSRASRRRVRIRGRMTAFDAKTGKERLALLHDPRPGRDGPRHLAQTGDAWKHGGAPVWQTPSVDPKLGLLYFSTGNTGTDRTAAARRDNLFAASIVALDAKTGKSGGTTRGPPRHLGLRRAEPDGAVRRDDRTASVHGHRRGRKTGWLYMLDRKTGKPLFPIPRSQCRRARTRRRRRRSRSRAIAPFVAARPASAAQVARVKKQRTRAAKRRVEGLGEEDVHAVRRQDADC